MKRLVAAFGLAALSYVPAAAQQGDTLRAELVRVNQAMMEAFNRGDALGVAAHYSDDARMVGPGGPPVVGRAAIDRYWTSFPSAGNRWTLEVLETGGDRNTAFQVGRSSIMGPKGAMVTEFAGVWQRQPSGELKLALDAWTGRGRPPDAALIDSIRALDRGWANAYAVHDTAYARALFADDIVIVSGTGSLKTRDTELADIRPQPNLVMAYFRTSDVTVRAYSGTAMASGIAEWSFTFNSRASTSRRRYTAMYVRGGPLGWRMVALQIRPLS
jgi:ketosteroid isomerase-like protein